MTVGGVGSGAVNTYIHTYIHTYRHTLDSPNEHSPLGIRRFRVGYRVCTAVTLSLVPKSLLSDTDFTFDCGALSPFASARRCRCLQETIGGMVFKSLFISHVGTKHIERAMPGLVRHFEDARAIAGGAR
jgi:hypothetical protein